MLEQVSQKPYIPIHFAMFGKAFFIGLCRTFFFGRTNYQNDLCTSEMVRLCLERVIMTRQKNPATSTPQQSGEVKNRIKLYLYLKSQN